MLQVSYRLIIKLLPQSQSFLLPRCSGRLSKSLLASQGPIVLLRCMGIVGLLKVATASSKSSAGAKRAMPAGFSGLTSADHGDLTEAVQVSFGA